MTSYICPSKPIIHIDIPFTPAEIALLSCLPKYITPLQSRFSKESVDAMVSKECEAIRIRGSDCLSSHCMSASDPHAKQFFDETKSILTDLYMAPVSKKLLARAEHENRLVLSIQRKLRAANAIIRRTDKSKVFYIGTTEEFEEKARNYMMKTCAYEEVANGVNPYQEMVNATLSLLHRLKEKQAINNDQYKMRVPDQKKCELPHLYFIPKAHKVRAIGSLQIRKVSYASLALHFSPTFH